MKVFLYKKAKKDKNFGIIMTMINYPVRMCIICKARLHKNSLFRYQIKQGQFASFCGKGRSFYICGECLDTDDKKIEKIQKTKQCTQILRGKKLKEIGTK